MLASSERFSSLWVTREEYEEHGMCPYCLFIYSYSRAIGPSIAVRIYKAFFKGEE